ncbi:MAG: cytochrome b N-terminal domain-containing protein [Candidatus Brocadiae bacterium]|nr:cytochrome b N-terminal domain-containing protein [Candidatus Brocadiia bacterium]
MFSWLEQRIKVKNFLLSPLFPRGIAAWSSFPAVLTLVFFLWQGCLGMVLVFCCKDASDVKNISLFMRNLHGIGGNILLISLLAHLCVEFFRGEYKRPGELVWVNSIFLWLLVCLSFVTGTILIANSSAQKTLEMFFMILRKFPLAGPYFYTLLQSDSPSVLWHRFYVLHICILPLLSMFVLFFYIWLVYRKSVSLSESKKP